MASRIVAAIRSNLLRSPQKDWEVYHSIIKHHLRPGMVILDVGCGKGNIAPFPWDSYKYSRITLLGLDPDPEAARHPHLHRFIHMRDPDAWDIATGSCDLAVCRYVLEHVASPPTFFLNILQALKPGGRLIFLTPNIRHPVMKVSRALSHRAKSRILGRTRKIASDDVFPTHYRCNTTNVLAEMASSFGMEIEQLSASEYQPIGYLDFSLLTFLPALAYYATLHAFPALDRRFGSGIIGVFRMPGAAMQSPGVA